MKYLYWINKLLIVEVEIERKDWSEMESFLFKWQFLAAILILFSYFEFV